MKTPPAPVVVKITVDKEKLTREDMEMVVAQMTILDSKAQKEPLPLSPGARVPLSLPQMKVLSLEKHDNVIIFTPTDFLLTVPRNLTKDI